MATDFNDEIRFKKGVTFLVAPTMPAAAPINTYPLVAYIDTTVSATARVARVIVPQGGAGTVVKVTALADVNIATGSLVLTAGTNSGGDPWTGGTITLTSGTLAGTLGTATPTEGAEVADHDVLRVDVSGSNTANGRATVTFSIQRS